MSQKVTVVQGRSGDYEVHGAGCRDLVKKSMQSDLNSTITVMTRRDVGTWLYADMIDEGSMTADEALSDIRFLPCCSLPSSVPADSVGVEVTYSVPASRFDINEFAVGAEWDTEPKDGNITVIERGVRYGDTLLIGGHEYPVADIEGVSTFVALKES